MVRDLAGLRVLVVDDTDDDRELVHFILSEHGAKVVLASSVTEGLAAFSREAPDVVVCDYLFRTGEPTGNSFISEVRRAPGDPGPRVPVVLLTGHGRDVSPRLLLEAGFDDVCVKPITPERLVDVLARVIKRTSVLGPRGEA